MERDEYFPPVGRWVHCENCGRNLGWNYPGATCQDAGYENCGGYVPWTGKSIDVPEGENTPYDSDWTAEDEADFQSPCEPGCPCPRNAP